MIKLLSRHGLRKGLFGGSKPWTIVWVAVVGVRVLRRLAAREPEVVYSEELAPGRSLLITAGDREPRIIT